MPDALPTDAEILACVADAGSPLAEPTYVGIGWRRTARATDV